MSRWKNNKITILSARLYKNNRCILKLSVLFHFYSFPFNSFILEKAKAFPLFPKCLFVVYYVRYDPFKLIPFALNILCQLQLTAGTNKIMLGISASEIIITGDIIIKES